MCKLCKCIAYLFIVVFIAPFKLIVNWFLTDFLQIENQFVKVLLEPVQKRQYS